jgi:hypothetical protein
MTRAKTEYVSPYDIASLYLGLGDKEKRARMAGQVGSGTGLYHYQSQSSAKLG